MTMLAERADTLHVFCYAPKAALVARAMRRLSVRLAAGSPTRRSWYAATPS